MSIEKRLAKLHKDTCEAAAIINFMITKRNLSRDSLTGVLAYYQSLTEQAKSLLEDTVPRGQRSTSTSNPCGEK